MLLYVLWCLRWTPDEPLKNWGVFWIKNSTNSHLHSLTPFRPIKLLSSCHSFSDEEVASLNMIKSAPVGPVAGGIMGCIMVLVLVVYAYRHQIHRRSHQHMSPLAAQGESDRIHTNVPTQRPRTECQGQSKRKNKPKCCQRDLVQNLHIHFLWKCYWGLLYNADVVLNQNADINLMWKSKQRKTVETFWV